MLVNSGFVNKQSLMFNRNATNHYHFLTKRSNVRRSIIPNSRIHFQNKPMSIKELNYVWQIQWEKDILFDNHTLKYYKQSNHLKKHLLFPFGVGIIETIPVLCSGELKVTGGPWVGAVCILIIGNFFPFSLLRNSFKDLTLIGSIKQATTKDYWESNSDISERASIRSIYASMNL